MKDLHRRDEREHAVHLAADRLAYVALSFGLVVLAFIRGVRGESAWDLLALVVLGGLVSLAYRIRHRAVDRRSGVLLLVSAVLAAVVAAIAVGIVVVGVLAKRS